MTFESSQVITLEDLTQQLDELTQRLNAGESLVLFQDNRPKFWLVGLDHFQSASSGNGSSPSSAPVSPPESSGLKIGALVQREMTRLFRDGLLSYQALNHLCDPAYCKQVFHNGRPILKRYDPRQSLEQQCRDGRGYNRYYHTIFTAGDQRFLLANTWYETHREHFLRWLADY